MHLTLNPYTGQWDLHWTENKNGRLRHCRRSTGTTDSVEALRILRDPQSLPPPPAVQTLLLKNRFSRCWQIYWSGEDVEGRPLHYTYDTETTDRRQARQVQRDFEQMGLHQKPPQGALRNRVQVTAG